VKQRTFGSHAWLTLYMYLLLRTYAIKFAVAALVPVLGDPRTSWTSYDVLALLQT